MNNQTKLVEAKEIPSQNEIQPNNGFTICDYELPETVLELILGKVHEEDILNCNLVCRPWKELIKRKSLWKKRLENNGKNWNTIPINIREHLEAWAVFYAHLRYGILSKNYIGNPSGLDDFEGWTIFEDGGHGWEIEEEPIGCDRLPDSPLFGRNDGCCFVSSWELCSKYYMADLWKEGLTSKIISILLPFQIKCTQMYATRVDSGAVFDWELRLLNSHEKIIQKYNAPTIQLEAGGQWNIAEYSFQFGTRDVDVLEDLRYIMFIHKGKDIPMWSGHFGMKFARSCITFEILDSEPAVNPETGSVTNGCREDGGRSTFP